MEDPRNGSAPGRFRAVLRQHRWLLAVACGLALLVGVADSLAQSAKDKKKRSNGRTDISKLTDEEVLERIPEEPDILINAGYYDLPSTTDMILLGNRATPALVNCLVNNLDASTREVCASVLAAARDVRAIEPLLTALDDPSYSVQASAITALGQIEGSAATPRLLEILEAEYTEGWMRSEVAYALAQTGSTDAIDPILARYRATWSESLQRALWDMRRSLTRTQIESIILEPFGQKREDVGYGVLAFSIERAGDLKLSAAVDPLIAYYEDADYEERNRIIYNLGRIGDAKAIPFLEALVDPEGEARLLNNVTFALQRLAYDVAPILRMGLADKRAYIRYNAAFVAGDLRDDRVVPELIGALEDVNDIVRSEAAIALGRIGSRDALDALEVAAESDNQTVVRDALWALLTIDYDQYRDRALEVVKTTDRDDTRSKLIDVLVSRPEAEIVTEIILSLEPSTYGDGYIAIRFLDRFQTLDNPDALAYLVRLASDGSHDAYRLLARFADQRTQFILENWFVTPRGEAEQMMRALARLGSDKRKEEARVYFERDGTIAQLYAAFYYAALGDPDGIELLLTALEVAPIEFKRNVAVILTELDYTKLPGAEERLLGLLQHSDVYVRLYAARPLAHRGEAAGVDLLKAELDKKIPFIQDETLAIVRQLPEPVLMPILEDWLKSADPMLQMDLQAIWDRHDGDAIDG